MLGREGGRGERPPLTLVLDLSLLPAMQRRRVGATLIAMRVGGVASVAPFLLGYRVAHLGVLRQVRNARLRPAQVMVRVFFRQGWAGHQTQYNCAGNQCLRSHLELSFRQRSCSFP